MTRNWRDDLNEPHHFTKGQLLRRGFACLVLLAAILVFAYKCEAQTVEQKQIDPYGMGKVAPSQPTREVVDPVRPSALLGAALGSYLTFSVIDAKQTGSCLSAGTCREQNALLKPFAGHPSGLVAVKLAGNSAVAYGIWKLRRRHPKAALALGIAAAGFQAAVVSVNYRRAQR